MRWRRSKADALELADISTLRFRAGTRVFVRDRYLGNWCSGFEVAEVLDDGYRVRRLTDRRVFPDLFAVDDVHLERRRWPRDGDGSFVGYQERRRLP